MIKCYKKLQKGFTLTELLVVVAIILTMSGVSLVFVSVYSPTYKLKGDANQIAAMIRKTQNYALTEQRIYGIQFQGPTAETNEYIISKYEDVEVNPSCTPAPPLCAQPQERYKLMPGITFTDIVPNYPDDPWGPALKLIYNASGTPEKEAVITIQNSKGEKKTIQVNLNGFVKIL